MLFNSLSFLIFFPIIFTLYWSINKKNIRLQNLLLLGASYYFYSCWDWRFLFLLLFSTALDYFTGIKIKESYNDKARKFWFWLSIGVNLGFLGVFKYYNFFAASFAESLSYVGLHISPSTLNIVLPVGISFYTFHGLSYVIDIYKRRIDPEINFVYYSLFVSFFPLLVAGPIERATHLLPQLKKPRNFNYSQGVSGLQQILWGLFKKVVIADSCAEYANLIFNNYNDYQGVTLLLGAFFFTIQIYGDFSGYSDIALGTARLLGIDLIRNFSFPYFSRDISEFWRRWHISLSTWFRDYLYIPLGGSKGSMWQKVRNTFIIFIVSGFWHGANWTFIIWGLLNALYILPLILFGSNRTYLNTVAQGKYLPTIREVFSVGLTFFLTMIAWIFFRAETVRQGIQMSSRGLKGMVDKSSYIEAWNLVCSTVGFTLPLLIFIFILCEWFYREKEYVFMTEKSLDSYNKWARYFVYFSLTIIIILVALYNSKLKQNFIYFQF